MTRILFCKSVELFIANGDEHYTMYCKLIQNDNNYNNQNWDGSGQKHTQNEVGMVV